MKQNQSGLIEEYTRIGGCEWNQWYQDFSHNLQQWTIERTEQRRHYDKIESMNFQDQIEYNEQNVCRIKSNYRLFDVFNMNSMIKSS